MSVNRPLALVDLDDTLFQTARKMPEGSVRFPASFDVTGKVSGYMSQVQKQFFEWLLQGTDMVPVTARCADAFSRVRLDFVNGAICSHGALLLNPDRSVNADWYAMMAETLRDYQLRLPELCRAALQIGEEQGISLRGWVVQEGQQQHYVVVKHNNGCDSDLAWVLEQINARGLLEDMHVHTNGNNLALLPKGLSKRVAVEHYLKQDTELNGERPVLGLGDSITDLGFMDLCHLWATPARSQLAQAMQSAINA
ncbi:trehalose phosphatase [Pseudomonas sp. LD120]|uniref:trehalose phosphatase n=1 Tax=Pseudomonas sp. LD120 TaxID=485751 RepID=UPI00135943F6|nr:trehalose phosphatase [Pseudomonas sp. LD120]KAF0864106.1 trehalose phosphatase [Pseudomonas sp. LD120]